MKKLVVVTGASSGIGMEELKIVIAKTKQED